MDLKKLKEPFHTHEVEWRVQTFDKENGKWAMLLAYVQSRAIMDRLDEVCGPENWETRVEQVSDGILCRLGLHIASTLSGATTWVWKEDGASMTDVEAFKGGISGALKRVAVQWGIGRYLYHLPATFVRLTTEKTDNQPVYTKDKRRFYWETPNLPAWALPGGGGTPHYPDPTTASGQQSSTSEQGGSEASPQQNLSGGSSPGTEGDELKILLDAWVDEEKGIMRKAWKKFDHGQLVGFAKAVNQLVGHDRPAAIVRLSTCDKDDEFVELLESVTTMASQMELF